MSSPSNSLDFDKTLVLESNQTASKLGSSESNKDILEN